MHSIFSVACAINNYDIIDRHKPLMNQKAESIISQCYRAILFVEARKRCKQLTENKLYNFFFNVVEEINFFDWWSFISKDKWVGLQSEIDLEHYLPPPVKFSLKEPYEKSKLNPIFHSLGPYSIRAATHYLRTKSFHKNYRFIQFLHDAEMLKLMSDHLLLKSPTSSVVVRMKIKSKNKGGDSSDYHKVFLIYEKVKNRSALFENDTIAPEIEGFPNKVDDFEIPGIYFRETIKFWYCTCMNGRRIRVRNF